MVMFITAELLEGAAVSQEVDLAISQVDQVDLCLAEVLEVYRAVLRVRDGDDAVADIADGNYAGDGSFDSDLGGPLYLLIDNFAV